MSWSWLGRVLPAAGLLLAGCGGAAEQELRQPELVTGSTTAAVVGLPAPMVGDRIGYDGGATLRVMAVDGGQVTMRRGKSTLLVRPHDPFLPPLMTDGAQFEVRSTVDAPPDALFPLAAGKTARFSEARWSRNKSTGRVRTTTRNWQCEVGEFTSFEVPLGTFDAWPVRCENPADDAFFRTARAYTRHYSPALGQVVQQRYERFRKAPRVKQLDRLTTTAPLARGEAFEAVMQSSFETSPSGEPVAWRDDGAAQAGTLTIRRTLKRADGTYCRDAEIALTTGDTPITQALRACRTPEGRWLTEAT